MSTLLEYAKDTNKIYEPLHSLLSWAFPFYSKALKIRQNILMRFIVWAHSGLFFFPAAYSQQVSCSEWQKLVPGPSLPAGVQCMKSNNNLDLVLYNERYFLAFRTAPTHFASKKTKLYILSSADLQNWKLEKEFFCGSDMREPRFVIFQNKLLFTFFEGGKKLLRFEPRKIYQAEYTGEKFSDPEDVGLDGYVPWRLKVHHDTLFLSAYYGVQLYHSGHRGDLRLFYSTDGKHFQKISDKPQCDWKGAEEGEFEFDEEGNLWATIRLEGEGALIAFADKDNASDWRMTFSKFKYDSAIMFKYGEDLFVIARRNLDGDGKFAKASRNIPEKIRHKYNLVRYSFTKKTTALYKLDKKNKKLLFITDLMGTGDTAFPAIVQNSAGKPEFILMNYSSDIHKKDKNWIRGQLSKSYIYWTKMCFVYE